MSTLECLFFGYHPDLISLLGDAQVHHHRCFSILLLRR